VAILLDTHYRYLGRNIQQLKSKAKEMGKNKVVVVLNSMGSQMDIRHAYKP